MGEVLKVKVTVPLLLLKANESAGIPFTVKSVGCTVEGSTGSLRLMTKLTGCALMKLLQAGVVVVTTKPTSSPSVTASCCDAPLMITRPSAHEVTCLAAVAEA